MIRLLAATLLPLLLLSTPAHAGGKKPEPLNVSFHLQATEGEGNKLVFPQMTAGQEVFYRISPEFSSKDVLAFMPFPADDEISYGVILQLSKTAAQRLNSISADNRGQYLLAVVNGNVRDAVIIDRPVTDGLLVIWQRVTAAEIRLADGIMPRIGQDPKEWKEGLKK